MSSRLTVAYKILTGPQKDELVTKGVFPGAPVDLADGYIHMSAEGQLAGTLDIHFAGQQDLWIAAVDLGALGDAVKWELSRGGQPFPHLYAPLAMEAVLACMPLEREPDGSVKLPIS